MANLQFNSPLYPTKSQSPLLPQKNNTGAVGNSTGTGIGGYLSSLVSPIAKGASAIGNAMAGFPQSLVSSAMNFGAQGGEDYGKQIMGTQATSPDTNVTKPSNTIPIAQASEAPGSQQAATAQQAIDMQKYFPNQTNNTGGTSQTAGAANNGLIGGFQSIVGNLANGGMADSPDVQAAKAQQLAFEKQYVSGQQDRAEQANPFGYMTNLMDINAAGHTALSPVYQQQVTNAYTGQGQRLVALGTAGQLAQPDAIGLTSQPYYPLEGQYGGGTNGIGARATTAANVNALGTMIPQYQEMQGTFEGIQNLQNGLNNLIGTKDILNPTSFPYVNQALDSILQKGVGDPSYKQLENYLTDIANRYSTYFASTGNVTNAVRAMTDTLINPNAKGSDITQVLKGLSDQANQVMSGTASQIQRMQNNPGGITMPQGSTPTTSGGGQYDW